MTDNIVEREQTKTKYPSIEHLKKKSLRLWDATCEEGEDNYKFYIEEKVDGSQLSFSLYHHNSSSCLEFFCKGKPVQKGNKTFVKAIMMLETIKDQISPDLIYHGEAVCHRQHNIANYHRTPKFYYVLYDVTRKESGTYLSPDEKSKEADRLGLEVAQILFRNEDPSTSPYDKCKELVEKSEKMEIQSMLGGKLEGVVLKHHYFVSRGRVTATKLKYVSSQFKESHGMKRVEKRAVLTPEEFLNNLAQGYVTDARFFKAYQHLRDQEKLQYIPKDIPLFKKELDEDFEKEYKEEILNYLWVEFGPPIMEKARAGAEDWYKERILEKNVMEQQNQE